MKSSILNLHLKVISIIISSIPVLKIVQVNMNYFDVQICLLVYLGVLKLVEIIIDDLLSHQELILNGWNYVHSPMSVI